MYLAHLKRQIEVSDSQLELAELEKEVKKRKIIKMDLEIALLQKQVWSSLGRIHIVGMTVTQYINHHYPLFLPS